MITAIHHYTSSFDCLNFIRSDTLEENALPLMIGNVYCKEEFVQAFILTVFSQTFFFFFFY